MAKPLYEHTGEGTYLGAFREDIHMVDLYLSGFQILVRYGDGHKDIISEEGKNSSAAIEGYKRAKTKGLFHLQQADKVVT